MYRSRYAAYLVILFLLQACETTVPSDLVVTPGSIWSPGQVEGSPNQDVTPSLSFSIPNTDFISESFTPTADNLHYSIAGDSGSSEEYIIQEGDILSEIAEIYGVSVETLITINEISDPNSLEVGQRLFIPSSQNPPGPENKIIPDSELVYGPLSKDFDIEALITNQDGYLSTYEQEIYGETLTGAEIIQRISMAYSINPRLLIALLEYGPEWVSNPNPLDLENPFGYIDDWYVGLYRQLAWASIQLNTGFYNWKSGTIRFLYFEDGTTISLSPTINAGTVGIQYFFAQLSEYETWTYDTSPQGFISTYINLFGNPFRFAIEPLIPISLKQPFMQLPFQKGEDWSFTGGPHLSWDSGTPFGALDFAPPGEALGCIEVDYWISAVGNGIITRTGNGIVALDLDYDGNEGSGWVIVYMHIEKRDRVESGVYLSAGESIGHPSCEGGMSSGTHVHIARKFNGVWIDADGLVPFVMDGWIPASTGEEYAGTMTRNGEIVESYEGNSTINLIRR